MTQTQPPPGPERQNMNRPDRARKSPILRAMVRSAVATTAWLLIVGSVIAGLLAVAHPDSPLPPEWNPTKPLQVAHPITPLTSWKFNKAIANPQTCLSTLAAAGRVEPQPPRAETDQCFIANRVDLRGVGDARLAPLETSCGIGLRMAMWERHSLQPAAREIYGTALSGIDHIGSYSCRRMRTSAGTGTRMSTHATAAAVDITGFSFADGQRISLIRDWDGGGKAAAYLRAARDGACDWFGLTLSPNYNALHADHFHLQARGWGGCR